MPIPNIIGTAKDHKALEGLSKKTLRRDFLLFSLFIDSKITQHQQITYYTNALYISQAHVLPMKKYKNIEEYNYTRKVLLDYPCTTI